MVAYFCPHDRHVDLDVLHKAVSGTADIFFLIAAFRSTAHQIFNADLKAPELVFGQDKNAAGADAHQCIVQGSGDLYVGKGHPGKLKIGFGGIQKAGKDFQIENLCIDHIVNIEQKNPGTVFSF